MRSRLAEQLEHERLEEEARLSPEARVRLALRLGREAVSLYRQLHPGTTVEEARRILARVNRDGRRPSGCAADE